MALELLLAAKLLTSEAEAADTNKFRPTTVRDMAAECVPTPVNVGAPVHFPVLDANIGAFNDTVGEIMGHKLNKKQAARLIADALLARVNGQVTEADITAQLEEVAKAYNDTDAASPSAVQKAREIMGLTRTTMERERAYLSLLVDPQNGKPVKVDTLFAETGLTPEVVSAAVRRYELARYAEAFEAVTNWDCSAALDYTAVNGQFPTVGVDLSPAPAEAIKVPVTLPTGTFDTTSMATYGENRAALVTEWNLADQEGEALAEQFAVVPRFARRYKADGVDPVLDLKLDPRKAEQKK